VCRPPLLRLRRRFAPLRGTQRRCAALRAAPPGRYAPRALRAQPFWDHEKKAPFSTRNQTKCAKHFVCVRFIECKLWPYRRVRGRGRQRWKAKDDPGAMFALRGKGLASAAGAANARKNLGIK